LANEPARVAAWLSARSPYNPNFDVTVRNVPQILFIGLRAAGSELKLAEVEELVFEAGFVHARLWAADYIALIVEPKPTAPEVEPDDDIDDGQSVGNVKSSIAGEDA